VALPSPALHVSINGKEVPVKKPSEKFSKQQTGGDATGSSARGLYLDAKPAFLLLRRENRS
jgi:hypothetical protein